MAGLKTIHLYFIVIKSLKLNYYMFIHMMDISVVYSIGIRCYTEIILKKFNKI